MELTRDGMARHVAEQSLAWQRQVAQDRIALLTKEAALHHDDDALIDTLGHAAATAARAHARVGTGLPGGEREDTAAATARSGVLGAAIRARLDRGDADGANALFTRIGEHLDPEHAAVLQNQLQSLQGSDNPPNVLPAADVQTAQSILPFLGKPPYYVTPRPSSSGPGRSGVQDVPKLPSQEAPQDAGPSIPKGADGTREYKVPVPRQSGKEAKNDVPQEYKGLRPYRGETPRETAERAMDEIEGKGNWTRATRKRLFDKLKKFYGEHFQDPKEIPPPAITPTDAFGRDIEA
ncbi:MAG: hypothetical protein JSR24_08240 [Proteobacteria bacterium]|nr:hypothetical protein [Pseudomonadota bacterium]